MVLYSASKLKKAFGADVLFDNVSFSIGEQDKIGLIGANGAGKTTLVKLLLGQTSHEGGELFQNRLTQIGYMEQQTNLTSDKTVLGELMTVFSHLEELERQLENVAAEISKKSAAGAAASELEELTALQQKLSDQYSDEGGYTYQSRARAALLGIGFQENELTLPFDRLSGGQKTRIFLTKILLGQKNLLLLDEPTNHLDLAAIEWLEGFLRDYKGAFVVISHDRYFLDRVTNRTFELENGKLTAYSGGYTAAQQQKAEARKAQERQFENTQREIRRIEGIIEQQKRWNRERNIRTAESKQKIIDRLAKTLDAPDAAPDQIHFSFHINQGGGNDVLLGKKLAMGFGEKCLFENTDILIRKKERVFLLGPNGCGKTTLLRLITGELQPLSGEITLGANIEPGYYDQTQDHLDYSKTIFEEVADAYPRMTQTEIRNALAAFLFRGEDAFQNIGTLSGGERARVTLLKLMLSGSNFLLLDEPTNHLDIASREMLEEALLHYEGTVLCVSHDRYFINRLATRVLYMEERGLKNYLGNYDYFLEKHNAATETGVFASEKTSSKQDYQRKKQQEAAERKRLAQLARLEQEIARLEQEAQETEAELATPECGTDYARASELTERLESINSSLLSLYGEWDENA